MICPNCNHQFNSRYRPIDTFEKHAVKGDGCWGWNGYIDRLGYAVFGKHSTRAHRFSYQIYKGEIPEGLVIDHLCRNRSCTNPDHLEAVTQRVNAQRGLGGMHLAKNPDVIARYNKILAKHM